MLPLVPDLRRAFAECARVLQTGGHMLIFTNFATERMEHLEADRIYGPLGICADNLSVGFFEAASSTPGFGLWSANASTASGESGERKRATLTPLASCFALRAC